MALRYSHALVTRAIACCHADATLMRSFAASYVIDDSYDIDYAEHTRHYAPCYFSRSTDVVAAHAADIFAAFYADTPYARYATGMDIDAMPSR